MIEYEIGPDGFSDCTPGSLPSRMEGVYRLKTYHSEEADWPDEYIELYEIFGNLYGFYSGWGYSAINVLCPRTTKVHFDRCSKPSASPTTNWRTTICCRRKSC